MELSRPIPKWESVVFWGIAGIVVFAPLAFGSVHVWAYTLLETGVLLLLLVHAVGRLALDRSGTVGWVKTPANGFLLLLLCMILLQAVPLPHFLSALLSPQTYADKQAAFSILDGTDSIGQAAPEGNRWFHLSYYRHETLIEGSKLLAYVLLFFLVVNTIHTKRGIDTMLWVLVLVGIFESAYGIFQVTASGPPRVWWWVRNTVPPVVVSGTFTNSSHFSFFMEMVFFLTAGLLISNKNRRMRLIPGASGLGFGIQRLVAWFDPESANSKRIFLTCALLLIGLGLILSRSRGGVLSLFIGLLTMGTMLLIKKGFKSLGMQLFLLVFILMLVALQTGGDSVLEKFKKVEGLKQRLAATASIAPMVADYPLFGVGIGNFKYLFPRYRIPQKALIGSASGHAHNDWAEFAADAGIVGLFILFLGYCIFLFRLTKIWLQREDPHAVGIGAGTIAALVAVGFHSFFDFSLHIPANPALLAVVAGLGYIALHRTGHGYGEKFFFRVRSTKLTIRSRLMVGVGVISLVLTFTNFIWDHFLSETYCPTEKNSTLKLNSSPHLTEIQKAIGKNPMNAQYYDKMADYFITSKVEAESVKKEFNKRAIFYLKNSLALNPAKGWGWINLGSRFVLKEGDGLSSTTKWLNLADQCFDFAIHNMPKSPGALISAGHYWVWRSSLREGPEADTRYGGSIKKFQSYYRRALALRPGYWRWVVEKVWEYYPDDATIFSVIPPGSERLKRVALQWMAEKLS